MIQRRKAADSGIERSGKLPVFMREASERGGETAGSYQHDAIIGRKRGEELTGQDFFRDRERYS